MADNENENDQTDWKVEAEKWKALSRKNEEYAKSNAEKAKQFDELSPELETLRTDNTRLVAENGTLTGDVEDKTKEITRLNVGIDKGLPKSLIARLQGDDEESLTTDAEALLEFVPADAKPAMPKADPSQGNKPTGAATPAQQFAEAFNF